MAALDTRLQPHDARQLPTRSVPAACPPERRTTWDSTGRDNAFLLAGAALVALILSAVLASAARRERLAEEFLAESKRRHD